MEIIDTTAPEGYEGDILIEVIGPGHVRARWLTPDEIATRWAEHLAQLSHTMKTTRECSDAFTTAFSKPTPKIKIDTTSLGNTYRVYDPTPAMKENHNA